MTAKMISTGKNDPRITNLLDKKGVNCKMVDVVIYSDNVTMYIMLELLEYKVIQCSILKSLFYHVTA